MNHDLTGGNPPKPFPIESNFIRDVSSIQPSGMGEFPITTEGGQVKYARREGAPSIYKDETRNTANDDLASAKAESSCMGEEYEEGEESQGI